MRIHQIMHRPVVCCSIDDTAAAAAALMWDHDCGAIPVVGREGRIAGMITDRDICMAAYTRGLPLRSIQVESIMSTPVISCQREDLLSTASSLMASHQVRRIPVIDADGRPVGIVSLNDVARAIESMERSGTGTALSDEVVHTISSICAPRQRAMAMV